MAGFKLEHLLLFRIIKRTKQRVRSLLIVVKHVVAASSCNARWQTNSQTPARQVHFVDALVAHISVPTIPLPMPIVVQLLAAQRLLRGRPAPKVVVHPCRHRLRTFSLSNGWPPLVAEASRHVDIADGTFAELLDRFAQYGRTTSLGAVLTEPVVLSRSVYQLPAFPDIMRAG